MQYLQRDCFMTEDVFIALWNKGFLYIAGYFKVRETFLNSMTPSVDYLLQPSVAVTNVSGRDYGNMSDLNITFTAEKLLYNYPVEFMYMLWIVRVESKKFLKQIVVSRKM